MSDTASDELGSQEEPLAASSQQRGVLGMAGIALLSLAVGVGATFGIMRGNVLPGSALELDRPLEHAQLAGLYREFRCPCCDQDIGECACPLAEERRNIISELATLGASRRDIYQFMMLHDGPTVFFDQSLAAEVSGWLEARLPTERPELSVEPLSADLGTVSMAEGTVSTRFQVSNSGQADLTITGLATSCMCTTAALETVDGLGPTFGAHPNENPVGWSATLAPGEKAALIVTFDPNAHGPEAVGQFRRVVTLLSDDPLQPELEVEIAVEVVR